MRNFSKALENIRKAMRDQDEEFRREEGLEPKQSKPEPKIPSLKPEPQSQPSQQESGGNLSPDRFLNTSIGQKPEHAPESQDTKPEIVEVIPQKDSRHSWLYNEVAKAVQNASGDNPNTKVVAVFVPVVQSGHEFEDLPVHETVELPPVNEEDFRIEEEIDINEVPAAFEQELDESQDSHDLEEPASDEQEPTEQEEPAITEQESTEQEELIIVEQVPLEQEELVITEQEPQELEEPAITEQESTEQEEPVLTEQEPQELEESNLPEELSEEPQQAEHLDELLPESIDNPDPELAEAFSTMEEKLGESIAANETLPELELPDELDDDEIIDDIDESGEDNKPN